MISRHLVEMMGGQIGFESEEGKGSTFRFTAVFEKQQTESSTLANHSHELRGVKILVLDDHESNRQVVRTLLTSWGCRIERGRRCDLRASAASPGGPGWRPVRPGAGGQGNARRRRRRDGAPDFRGPASGGHPPASDDTVWTGCLRTDRLHRQTDRGSAPARSVLQRRWAEKPLRVDLPDRKRRPRRFPHRTGAMSEFCWPKTMP